MTSAPVNQFTTNTWDGENRRTVVQLPSAQSVEWRRAAGAGPGLDGYLQHYLGRPTAIPTTLSLADYVKEVKTGSSRWLKDQTEFRCFEGWQDGYGAFTASFREKDSLVEYIKDQAEHHRAESLLDEYRRLLRENGVLHDERYLA